MGTAEKYNSGYASPAKQGKKLSQRRRGSWEGLVIYEKIHWRKLGI